MDDKQSAARQCIKFVAPDQILKEFSWIGTETKYSFCELNLINIAFHKAIVQNLSMEFTIADYNKGAKTWIRHTEERIGRRAKII